MRQLIEYLHMNEGILIFFLTKPSRDITIEPIVANLRHCLNMDSNWTP